MVGEFSGRGVARVDAGHGDVEHRAAAAHRERSNLAVIAHEAKFARELARSRGCESHAEFLPLHRGEIHHARAHAERRESHARRRVVLGRFAGFERRVEVRKRQRGGALGPILVVHRAESTLAADVLERQTEFHVVAHEDVADVDDGVEGELGGMSPSGEVELELHNL